MKTVQWIIGGMLFLATGFLSWGLWTQNLFQSWQGPLTVWFVWYALQVVLSLPKRFQWSMRLLSTTFALSGLFWLSGVWSVELSNPFPTTVASASSMIWTLGAVGLVVCLLLWLHYAERKKVVGLSFVRHSIVLVVCSIIVELLQNKGIDAASYWLVALIGWLSLVFTIDWLNIVWCFRTWNGDLHFRSPVLNVVAGRLNPLQSSFDALERLFGIDIQGTWIIRFVRQMLEPLAVVLVLLGWVSTSMVQLHPNEQGVRSSFGQPEDTVLKGGLHWKLPYPFGRVDRVVANRIHQLSIGHEEEASADILDTEEEAPESILWANQHGEEEFLLLLGDGHDVMSADGVLEYRISNVHQYLFGVQNPEEVLESVVYQVLMEQISSRTLEEALSENLIVLAEVVTTEIQDRIGQYSIGIEPLLFTFTALHPPVAVAKDYQDVVSAQIDQQTKVLRAEQYKLSILPKTRATAIVNVEKAKQTAALGLASANGEAISFDALRQTVRSQESLYRFRRRQENLQQSIKGRNIVVLDHRLESQGATLWINP